MKMIAIIAALATGPLMAQDQPAEQPAPESMCSCQQQQDSAEPKCPEAGMAAAFGFQKGYHMGFEAGFAEAIHLVRKASCTGGCKGGKHGKCDKRGMHDAPKPMTAPGMQPMPAALPTQTPTTPTAVPATPAPAQTIG